MQMSLSFALHSELLSFPSLGLGRIEVSDFMFLSKDFSSWFQSRSAGFFA